MRSYIRATAASVSSRTCRQIFNCSFRRCLQDAGARGHVSANGRVLAGLTNLFVHPIEVGKRHRRIAVLFDRIGDHPHLQAPITDVILPNHPMTDERKNSRETIADDRPAQVADMHFLGDVRPGIIDHDRLRNFSGDNPESLISRDRFECFGDPGGRQLDIDEARPRDRGASDAGEIEPGDDLFRHRTRIFYLDELCQAHGDIGLIVAELVALRGNDQRVGVGAECRPNGGAKGGVELSDNRLHDFDESGCVEVARACNN